MEKNWKKKKKVIKWEEFIVKESQLGMFWL